MEHLVRLTGPTPEPEDDIIVELKRVRSLAGIPCIQADDDDPFRVLQGGARIAYQPFRFLGFVEHGGEMFWTHAEVAGSKRSSTREAGSSPRRSSRRGRRSCVLRRNRVPRVRPPPQGSCPPRAT